jgi:hypothetical protein
MSHYQSDSRSTQLYAVNWKIFIRTVCYNFGKRLRTQIFSRFETGCDYWWTCFCSRHCILIDEIRLISVIFAYKLDISASLSQNKEFFKRTQLTGPVHTDRVPNSTSLFRTAKPSSRKCRTT